MEPLKDLQDKIFFLKVSIRVTDVLQGEEKERSTKYFFEETWSKLPLLGESI